MCLSHCGPETLEEAVQHYINRNVDTLDLPCLVSEVLKGLNCNPKICLPCGQSYSVISSFIREACRIAWEMSCLAYPLDIAFAIDSECFDDCKYRRSFDSDYCAPLVAYHAWPALLQGSKVVSKGEAVTRRAACVVTTRSRCVSPVRTTCVTTSTRYSSSPSLLRRSRSVGKAAAGGGACCSDCAEKSGASSSHSHSHSSSSYGKKSSSSKDTCAEVNIFIR